MKGQTSTATLVGVAIHSPALRFAVRAIVSALIAFWIGRLLHAPLHGLWAVLTAVVVLQMSAGASIRATTEYVLGTFAGAVYASVIALIPHKTPQQTALLLALAIGPLAYMAARVPIFRVAPFTAIIVLLLAGQLGEGPVAAAFIRLLEVALGGAVAIAVSLLVFPEPAHGLGRRQAVNALQRLAQALPELLSGFTRKADAELVSQFQDQLGASVSAFAATVAEGEHERHFLFASREDAGPFARTLLRLRHDFVIIGRAAADPLPPAIAARFGPVLAEAGERVSQHLLAGAHALETRQPLRASGSAAASLDACAQEIAAMRSDGLTRALDAAEVEQFFALGFALEELKQNLADLDRCVRDWARR